jgi:hypothetical protein
MTQQINLFSAVLRPRREVPAVAWPLAGTALVGALALAYYAYADSRASSAQAQLAGASADLKSLEDQLVKLKPAGPQGTNQALERSIALAESELKAGDTILQRLSGGGLGNTRGFSEYMTALARQRQQGVWITGLRVNGDGSQFGIRGGALNPDMLPEYIRRLSREEVLRGMPIADLRMQRKELVVKEKAPAPAAGSAEAKGEPPQKLRFVEFSIGTGAGPQGG